MFIPHGYTITIISMQYLLKAWPTIIELASVYKRLREFEAKLKFVDEKEPAID